MSKDELNFSIRNILTFIFSLAIFFTVGFLIYNSQLDILIQLPLFALLFLSIPIIVAIANIPTLIFRLYYIFLIYKAKIAIREDGTKIIAITGSTGKTSTREMLVKILKSQGSVLSTGTNFNSLWGNSIVLSNYNHEDYIVLEFAMDSPGHVGVQSRIIKPDLGAILNIGDVHAENVGSIEKIYKGKKELADYLLKNDKKVVLNDDDEWLKKIIGSNDPNIITHGYHSKQYKLLTSETQKDGLNFSFSVRGENYSVELPVYGNELAYNAMTAIILAKEVGVKLEESIKALKSYSPPPGRFEVNELGNTVVVNDAYNANPTSMKMSLESFDKIFSQEEYTKIVILGDMKELGKVSDQRHKELGELVKSLKFDEVYYIGDYFEHFLVGEQLRDWKEAKEIVEEIVEKDKKEAILLKASNSIKLHKILSD